MVLTPQIQTKQLQHDRNRKFVKDAARVNVIFTSCSEVLSDIFCHGCITLDTSFFFLGSLAELTCDLTPCSTNTFFASDAKTSFSYLES